ncbi:MAG: hypothetical protein JRG97_03220 [Deltaproteobacteria bacterium]|nr:hypothetical protein [Deltaproteobacteria bacterium]MBW2140068.1 hypothetical protein [Deltaproteobacteria bacterium]MBW2322065.1 hypothetical protein [Deltaproteobacteria bacterium]
MTEAFKVMSLAACMFPEVEPGTDFVNPNQLYTNIAKYMYAENFHQVTKIAQDICGGIAADPISYDDWNNPEERPYLEKYLGAKDGIATEDRLKAIRLIHDITGGRHGSHQIHAEGSLATQQMMFYANGDWDMYKAAAKRDAGIPGWEKDPKFGAIPDYTSLIASKMPPVDTSYNI